jgi:ParB family transcriptional regulator, chromosome partitioning protein
VAISDRIPNSKATVGATRRFSAITIGVRHRRDLGDIAGLATSIAEIGLLNPITVDENERMVPGARRLAARKRGERPLRGQRW